MAVRFISEKNKGIYAYVEYADGKNFEVDYTYLKNVANVKKAINVEYERMDCHIVITECDGLFETAICEKTFVPGIRKNWKTIKPAEVESQPAEVESQPAEVESQPAEVESQPAEVESQPAEVESQPAEVESQPAEVESQPAEVESQPADEPAAKCRYGRYGKLKGRYVAIQKKMITIDKDIINKYYLFDVSLESNKINIMKFTDNFVGDSIAVAYILDEYQKEVIIRSKKIYTHDKRTLWIRKNDELSNSFLDDFRK